MVYKVIFKDKKTKKSIIVDIEVKDIKELYSKLSDKRLGTILSIIKEV